MTGGGPAERTETTLRILLSELELIKAMLKSRIEPRLLNLDQVAAYIGRSRKAVEHLVKTKAFGVVRHGDRIHVDRNVLDAWIERGQM